MTIIDSLMLILVLLVSSLTYLIAGIIIAVIIVALIKDISAIRKTAQEEKTLDFMARMDALWEFWDCRDNLPEDSYNSSEELEAYLERRHYGILVEKRRMKGLDKRGKLLKKK